MRERFMTSDAFGQAILDEIKHIGARLESRMSELETRMSGLETRMSGLETQMSGLENRMSGLETRMSGLESRMSGLTSRMSTIENVVADLNFQIKSWPDMHFLAAAAKTQLAYSRETKATVSDIKVRLGEIYQAMATDPEVRSLRDDVASFRDQSADIEVRVGTIEGHIGIENPVNPR